MCPTGGKMVHNLTGMVCLLFLMGRQSTVADDRKQGATFGARSKHDNLTLTDETVTQGARGNNVTSKDTPAIYLEKNAKGLFERMEIISSRSNNTYNKFHDPSILQYALTQRNISMNWIDEMQRYCYLYSEQKYGSSIRFEDAGQLYCNSTWDTVSCWPTTLAGHFAMLPCPLEYDGVQIDATGNATKMCHENGTWEIKSDYSKCLPYQRGPDEEDMIHNFIIRVIYYVGFTTSIAALIVALFIFMYFRSLRCLRNLIHSHLIVTFMLKNLMWLIMNSALSQLTQNEDNAVHQWTCKMMVMVFNYFQGTNFFWMLIEGLYLHTIIVWAFAVDRIRFWVYVLIGWCGPGIFVITWAIVKALKEDVSCWLPIRDSHYDFIYITPILAVLLINIFFLGSIVYVLITKLRASNSIQTMQYRKAVRATLILFPLLGVTYVLFITSPSERLIWKRIFVYSNAILQSFQGLAVAVFYCFLNGEVRSTIKGRLDRWRDGRSIAATRYTRGSIGTDAAINMNGRPSVASIGKFNFLKNNNENGKQPQQETPMLTSAIADEAV